jgi:hypothetical protein
LVVEWTDGSQLGNSSFITDEFWESLSETHYHEHYECSLLNLQDVVVLHRKWRFSYLPDALLLAKKL